MVSNRAMDLKVSRFVVYPIAVSMVHYFAAAQSSPQLLFSQ